MRELCYGHGFRGQVDHFLDQIFVNKAVLICGHVFDLPLTQKCWFDSAELMRFMLKHAVELHLKTVGKKMYCR